MGGMKLVYQLAVNFATKQTADDIGKNAFTETRFLLSKFRLSHPVCQSPSVNGVQYLPLSSSLFFPSCNHDLKNI